MTKKGVSKYDYTTPLKCTECNIDIPPTYKRLYAFTTKGYIFCGSACSSNSSIVRDKTRQTCLEKYGVENALQNLVVQENKKKTSLKKYGVEFASQTKESQNKGKETCLKKYGVKTPLLHKEFLNKKDNTCKYKYGASNPLQNPLVMSKKNKTCLEKYGFEYSSQSPEIFSKRKSNWFKRNLLIIDNFTFSCQGYEKQAIIYLTNELKVDPVKILDQPKHKIGIRYILKNKPHIYHPDFFIPTSNELIEVKSTYTMCGTEVMWEALKEKRKACLKDGYNFKLMVMTASGKQVPLPKNIFRLGQKKAYELAMRESRIIERS